MSGMSSLLRIRSGDSVPRSFHVALLNFCAYSGTCHWGEEWRMAWGVARYLVCRVECGVWVLC